jgi:hypothetical protein
MLTKVEIRTAQGALLTLPLQDISEGYAVKDIEGLDPVKATLVYSSFAGQDGTQFQSARRENRGLILKLGFEPDYALTSAAALRTRLYGYLMPKSLVQLRFYEDTGLVVNVSGRVESLDSPRFTKDPDATIAITCENPDFDTLVNVTYPGNTTSGTIETEIRYAGTVETGFIFTMNVDRTISGFTIYNTDAATVQRTLPFSSPMLAGDVLKISTVPGNKYALLTRAGVQTSVMYGVSSASNWLNLFPGINRFRVLLSGAVIPWSVSTSDKYGAI